MQPWPTKATRTVPAYRYPAKIKVLGADVVRDTGRVHDEREPRAQAERVLNAHTTGTGSSLPAQALGSPTLPPGLGGPAENPKQTQTTPEGWHLSD